MNPKHFLSFVYGGLYASCIWYIAVFGLNDRNVIGALSAVGLALGTLLLFVLIVSYYMDNWKKM